MSRAVDERADDAPDGLEAVRLRQVNASCVRLSGELPAGLADSDAECPVCELGPGGVEVETGTRFDVGDVLSVSIHVPGTRNFLIVPAHVTSVARQGHAWRVRCAFSQMPLPLVQRVRRIMREYRDGARTRSHHETEAVGDSLEQMLNDLTVNQELFIDVLELYAMGVNLRDVGTSHELHSEEEPSEKPARRIPIYEFDENGSLPLDNEGAPDGQPVDHLHLPLGDGGESFGCRCTRRIDAFPGMSFNRESILVFSYERVPSDCDVILCPTGSRAVLGRLYVFQKGKLLVFQPAGGKNPPVLLNRPIDSSGYRLSARYERL